MQPAILASTPVNFTFPRGKRTLTLQKTPRYWDTLQPDLLASIHLLQAMPDAVSTIRLLAIFWAKLARRRDEP